MFLPARVLEQKLGNMLLDDLGEGDVTTTLSVPVGVKAEAEIRCKETGVIAGIEEARVLAESLGLEVQTSLNDGDAVKKAEVIMEVSGDARTILSLERTLLNLLSRMSGIATGTKRLTEMVQKAGLKTRVACTRKTAPGLLYFDKKAVFLGSGDSHRLHLDDMVLLKDNHILIAGGVGAAIERVRAKASFSKKIEIEVTSPSEALEAAQAGADVIMLDNFSPEKIRCAIRDLDKAGIRGNVLLEASGGITEKNILEFALTRVDIVSLGEITESPRALDMNMKIIRVSRN